MIRARLRSLPPSTVRGRLILAFAGVLTFALLLVVIALPSLLDGYFAQQEQKNLETRANLVAVFIDTQLRTAQALETTSPHAIVLATEPPTISPSVRAVLGDPADPKSLISQVTTIIAQADLDLSIALDSDHPEQVVYRTQVGYHPDAPAAGQERDQISYTYTFTEPDTWWSQFPGTVPARLFTLTLSDPYTFRAQTLRDVAGVLLAAALVALIVAVLASILIAQRLTTPIRRLTRASRALGEGDLTARVPVPAGAGSPELGELATSFNRMADRLEESIEVIRRDRDRSRDFLADVSHELRTPIAALRTFNELLQEGAAEDPQTRREFLESSHRQIERLDWLATNLLELSKLDSGLVALDLRPDDLRAAVEAALQQAEPAARRKGVTLAADLPPEPLRLRHDPQRIGQVLSNLIGNSVKFTRRGGHVTVGLVGTPDGAELRVIDTGVGIPADELPHFFDRFYRGAQANEERGSGSGLGLSIVRSIVEMHGGRVSVESTPGVGTVVTVFLPREVTQSSPGA
ncbi:MAG: HAMP domain-containing sensor histidine kinase [Candidatus Limnocylindrales bacterium]